MTFPSFTTTGPTRDITVQPLEYKALNLLPLIQMMQEDGKRASTSAATTKATTDDTKLEGRVGGVNQIMAEVNKYDNVIKNGINLMGDAFTGTPEYARAVRGREYALSEEVKNTLGRETKNVELYKEQIKGKGHYFHLPQYITSGVMKRAKDWQSVLEYGKSDDFYGYVGGEYISNFDFTPVLPNIEDSRQAVDALFKEGYISGETGWTDVEERIVGNTVGVVTAYKNETSKRNFQRVNEKGEPIEGPQALEFAHNQALARALSGMDVTDPLSGGYFQNFLQIKAGNGSDPFREYRNEKNIVSEEGLTKFFEDYSKHVQEDLMKQKNKRKIEETGSTTRESFVVSEEGTRALAAKQEAELAARAWTGIDESHADFSDFGMEAKWFEGGEGLKGFVGNMFDDVLGTGSGLTTLSDKDKEYLYAMPWSPFYKQSLNGKTYYNTNEDVNWAEVKENIAKDAIARGIADPEKYADKLVSKAKIASTRFEELRKDGKTYKATGRYDSQAQFMNAMQVPQWFVDGANRKDLIGQDTEAMGTNTFAKIGETYLMLNDIKGLKYAGTEGGIKMTSNTVPTNLFTRVIENGQEKIYNWSSEAWRTMDESKKDKIIELSQEQSKSNPRYGTMLLNGAGGLDNVVKKDRAIPMDEYSQRVLANLANDPNSSLNMVFASPAAYTTTGKFRAKTEAEIAKAFKGVNIYIEMPESYLSKNEKDKKLYLEAQEYVSNQTSAIYPHEIDSKKPKPLVNDKGEFGLEERIKMSLAYKLNPTELKEFQDGVDRFVALNKSKMRRSVYRSAIKTFATDYLVGRQLNYQNNKTHLTPVPVSEDGYRLNGIAKQQLSFTPYTEGTGTNIEKGFQVFMEFDATGITVRNVTDPKLQKDVRTWDRESQLMYAQGRNFIVKENKNKSNPYSKIKAQK